MTNSARFVWACFLAELLGTFLLVVSDAVIGDVDYSPLPFTFKLLARAQKCPPFLLNRQQQQQQHS